MKVLILTTNYSKMITGMLDKINTEGHDINIWWVGKCDFSDVPEYDVGISFMYTYKVPAKEVNSHTWINFHPAPLPEYKGRNLCYHAIINGEMEFGSTIHYMSEEIDEGPIIQVDRFKILPSDTAEDIFHQAINFSRVQFSRILSQNIKGRNL